MKRFRTVFVCALLLVASIFATFAFAGCSNDNGDGSGTTTTPPNNNPNENLVFVEQSDGTYGVKTTNSSIVGALVIPATYNDADVSIVLERGFFNCTKLTSVIIPNTVKIIDKQAFDNCYGLNSVTIYPSIEEIKVEAFRDCGEFDLNYIGTIRDFNIRVASGAYLNSTVNRIYQSEAN